MEKYLKIKINITKDGIVCNIAKTKYIVEQFKDINNPIIYDIGVDEYNGYNRTYKIYYKTQTDCENLSPICYNKYLKYFVKKLLSDKYKYTIDCEKFDNPKDFYGNAINEYLKNRSDYNLGLPTTIIFPDDEKSSFILNEKVIDKNIFNISINIGRNIMVYVTKALPKSEYATTYCPILTDVDICEDRKIYNIYYNTSNIDCSDKCILDMVRNLIFEKNYVFKKYGNLIVNGTIISDNATNSNKEIIVIINTSMTSKHRRYVWMF